MSLRLVSKSMTLNDLKRCNGPYFALFHRIRQLLGRVKVKVVEDIRKLFATEMQPKASSFQRYITYDNMMQGTPPSAGGGLNTRGSQIQRCQIQALSTAISRKRCKIGGKLVLITNRKSYMSFRLVPKLVTLNDLERRNGPYFALFHRIRYSFRGAMRKRG